MGKAILEFTLNGRKHTYFRRTDLYGKPLTTTNKNSARHVKESDIKGTIALDAKRLVPKIQQPKLVFEPGGRWPENDGTFFG